MPCYIYLGGEKMQYKIQHITNKRKLTNRSMTPEYLTIHSTSNPTSTAQNERDNLNRAGNTTSTGFHIAVDEKQAIECIPLNMVAYHAGDGANGAGNSKTIGIEICESGNREKTIQNAVELVAKMLKERSWEIDKLRRHYDWTKNSGCPRILAYNNWEGWDTFKLQVEEKLKKTNKEKKLDIIKIKLHDKEIEVEGYFRNGINYIPIRFLENMGYDLDWQEGTVTIEYRKQVQNESE